MALRYSMCGTCENVQPQSDLQQPWLQHDAQIVQHNKNRDPRETVREILRAPTTDVHASVGAGKSTTLPRAIAAETRLLVFMVVPNQLQATQLYDYVTSDPRISSDGVKSVLLETARDEIPTEGVAYVGAAIMTSILLTQGVFQIFQGKVIYLDEAHESDAYSFTLRNLAVELGAEYLIRASATFSLDKVMSTRNLCTSVETGVYSEDETPLTWDLGDPDKPWYYRQAGNTLVFTDSNSEAEYLLAEYTRYGYKAFRLTSKMPVADFREAVASAQGMFCTALIADYSFRSGFTFKVTNVIDTGRVLYMNGKQGVNERLARPIYKFESEQAQGRLGRIPGLPARYHRPAQELAILRTDLEGVESEAAAYLYRLIGYKPPPQLAGRVMATMNIASNRTLASAFNDERPLTCQELVSTTSEPIPPDIRRVETASTSSDSGKSSVSSTQSTLTDESYPDDKLSWEQIVNSYRVVRDKPLVDGEPYCAAKIPPDIENKIPPTFPLGAESVMTFVESNHDRPNLVHILTEDERNYALAVVLRKYNVAIAEILAVRRAVERLIRQHNLDPGEPVACQLVRSSVSNIKRLELERRYLFKIMRRLLVYEAELTSFHGIDGLVAAREASHYNALENLVRPVVQFDLLDYSKTYDRLGADILTPTTFDGGGNVLTFSAVGSSGSRELTVAYSDETCDRRYVRGCTSEAIAEYEARKHRFRTQTR